MPTVRKVKPRQRDPRHAPICRMPIRDRMIRSREVRIKRANQNAALAPTVDDCELGNDQ